MGRKGETAGENIVEKTRQALAAGDITRAEILSREYLQNNAKSEAALRARLQVLSALKDFAGAVEVISGLIGVVGGSRDLFFEGAYYSELGGNYELAVKGYEKALELEPQDTLSLLGIGRCLLNSVGIRGADTFFSRVLELEPDNQEAAEFLALAYEKEADFVRGIPFCEQALEKFEQSWMLEVVLGNLISDSGMSAKGLIHVSKGLSMQPDHVKPYVSAAALLNKMRRPFEALGFLEKAKALSPGDMNILLEESALLRAIGRSREALAVLEQVLKYLPNLAQGRSNYLFYLHDINGISRERILAESERYEEEVCSEIVPLSAEFENELSCERILRLGFLSADLREHSVAYFLLPLLRALDRGKFEIYLFSSNVRDDAYTEIFRSLSTEFLEVRDVADYKVAELIRKKKIDILLELGGHTEKNRLNVCAYRPAPVQVNWLGYPDTTGMKSIGYRIVDEITDPSPEADSFATEKLLRLPRGFLCYEPPEDVPEVSTPPVLENSYITYGSFSNMAKINPDMIALWARLLTDNPGSRLFLKNKALGEEQGRKEISARFEKQGVAPERLILAGSMQTTREHLMQYAKVDIALDTFPYNGTTTIFEALYMGVPVVGLCGRTHASRVGADILTRVGLEQLVATTPQQYLQITAALSRQVTDLERLRLSMRSRLAESGILDRECFAADFSELLLELWARYITEGSNNAI